MVTTDQDIFLNTAYLLANFLTQNHQPSFWMMSLFTTHPASFLYLNFCSTAIKAESIAHVTPSVIQKTQELNI